MLNATYKDYKYYEERYLNVKKILKFNSYEELIKNYKKIIF